MFLVFEFKPMRSSDLVTGTISFVRPNSDGVDVVTSIIACTSHPGRQYLESQFVRFGILPVREDYTVETFPVNLNDTPGVDGAFFRILPSFFKVGKLTRGDFGVHFDSRYPGTNGCIGIKNQKGWHAFKREMSNLHHSGVKTIPLKVVYS